jgi:hypothetical protein
MDVRFGQDFDRLRVTTKREQQVLVTRIRAHLARPSTK